MSSKEFNKRNQDAPIDQKSNDETPKLEYQSWFSRKLKSNGKLQAHHYPVILAYFKSHNLTELENESDYDSALNKFGY